MNGVGMQRVHQRGAMRQHSTLVDRALVGHFTFVIDGGSCVTCSLAMRLGAVGRV